MSSLDVAALNWVLARGPFRCVQVWSHGFRPPGLIDRDLGLGNRPRIAHTFVQSRLVLEPVTSRAGSSTEPARSARGDGKSDPADAPNLQVKIVGGRGPARRKFPRHGNSGKLAADFG
jgi:hypothetical protein